MLSFINWHLYAQALRKGVNIKSIAMAYRLYAYENQGIFPPLGTGHDLPVLENMSIAQETVPESEEALRVICGRSYVALGKSPLINEGFGVRYVYFGLPIKSLPEARDFADRYRASLQTQGRPSGALWRLDREEPDHHVTPLLFEIPRMYPGLVGFRLCGIEFPVSEATLAGIVAYTDGHVEFIPYPGPWPMDEGLMNLLSELCHLDKPFIR